MTTAEELTRIIGSKNSLKTSIENKGVTVPDDALIDSYYEYVDAIEQGGGGVDFSVIGYDSTDEQPINDAIAYSKELYDAFVPSTNLSNLYASDTKLMYAPKIDTSMATNMYRAFYNCTSLVSLPFYNTSNVNNMQQTFYNCRMLQTLPPFDLSKVTSISYLFYNCTGLISLPAFNVEKVTSGSFLFNSNIPLLTDFGGFINLKCNLNDNYSFSKCPNLTHQSLINILNGLYDFTGAGQTPTSSQGKLKLGTENYNKLSAEDLAIGTNKGWQITA